MASVRKSITRRGTLRWQAVWNEPGLGGSTRQRTKNFARQSEAREHAARMTQEIEGRGVGDPQQHSVERYLRRWLATLADRNEHSPSTLSGYRRYVALANKYIGHISLERLSPADLDGLYAELLRRGGVSRQGKRGEEKAPRPLNPRTVLHVHRVLHTAFEQARKWKLIRENPSRDATAPSVRKSPVRAFTEDEVGRLLAAAAGNPETHCILVTLLITGTRRSELCGLAWDMVDLDRGTITIRRVVIEVDRLPVLREVPKSEGSERTIKIPPLLVELLQAQKTRGLEAALAWGKGYRKDPMFVFAQVNGEPLDPMSITYRLRLLMRRAKVSGRAPTHAWRHTCATALIDAGVDTATVQARLGHSTPAITLSTYVHRTERRDTAAGEQLAALVERQGRKG
jgi:integrase